MRYISFPCHLPPKLYFSFSACTCPGEDHPGPSYNTGRGAPEIDVLEAEHNKLGTGGVVSQSAQFAPFSHDYVYANDTTDKWEVSLIRTFPAPTPTGTRYFLHLMYG